VIGVDAGEPALVERWMDEGRLPTMARLRAAGTYSRLKSIDYCRAETACTVFLTGCSASRTGWWSSFKFHPDDYSVDDLDSYEFDEFPPFYAQCPDRRIAVFDIPQTRIADGVDGIQVRLGAHAAHTPSVSVPDGWFAELTARYGEHPTYNKDECALWDARAMNWLKDGLETGILRRTAICRDLLQREPWDLFVTYFGETHTAGHYFWHLSQADHPLHHAYGHMGDWLLEVFVATDRAIGDILAAAPPGASILLFSDHGMESNSTDLPSFVFLPELLYRWSLPGHLGLSASATGRPAPAPFRPRSGRSWTDEVGRSTRSQSTDPYAPPPLASRILPLRDRTSTRDQWRAALSRGLSPRVRASHVVPAGLAAYEGVRSAELLGRIPAAQRSWSRA
jgi:hypothetical protein